MWLSTTICHLWKPELSSNLDGPSLEGFGFCQLTLYLALAISISFSLSKALRLIKPHKVTNRNQNSAGHLARKSHLRKIIVYCRKSVTLWLQIKEFTVKYCFVINWLYTEVFFFFNLSGFFISLPIKSKSIYILAETKTKFCFYEENLYHCKMWESGIKQDIFLKFFFASDHPVKFWFWKI